MERIILSVWSILLLLGSVGFAQQQAQELIASKRVLLLMGKRFEIKAVASSTEQADEGIDAGIKEIQRIEKLI